MDQQLTQPIQIPPVVAPQHKKGKLFFLEVGLFEVGFVVILLAVAFGVLSYFHVINLTQFFSYLFPSSQTKQTNITVSIPPDEATVTADTTLREYLGQILKSNFLPGKSTSFKARLNKLNYTLTWQLRDSAFAADVYYASSEAILARQPQAFTLDITTEFPHIPLIPTLSNSAGEDFKNAYQVYFMNTFGKPTCSISKPLAFSILCSISSQDGTTVYTYNKYNVKNGSNSELSVCTNTNKTHFPINCE